MCIIAYKPKGIELPSDEVIKKCFQNNSDGAGFMFALDNKVVIKKGYMNVNSYLQALKTLYKKYDLKDKNVVLHFRIGTSGGITPSKCHPFPLTTNDRYLNMTKLKCDYGVVHNGIFSDYVYGTLSDTQNYIKDFLKPLSKMSKDFNSQLMSKIIDNSIGSSKLIILDRFDNIYKFGEWCSDDNGIIYSNLSYKTNYYTSATKEYNYSYGNYNSRYNYGSYYNYNKSYTDLLDDKDDYEDDYDYMTLKDYEKWQQAELDLDDDKYLDDELEGAFNG